MTPSADTHRPATTGEPSAHDVHPGTALETSRALLAAGVSKPVFACRWPESRAVVEQLWAELPRGLGARLYDEPYLGGQDGMQDDLLRRWMAWRRDVVALDAAALPHRYATAGSSEAIRECLAQFAAARWRAGRVPVLHVLDGDYEGYAAVAEGYGIRTERHGRDRWRESLGRRGRVGAGDLLILSQPSAVDGNLWPDLGDLLDLLERERPETRVALDLSYVGAVAGTYRVDVTSPLVDTVFFSLSKVFGVYYHRIGGVLSRERMPGLVGTKWFKNTFSLALGSALLDAIPATAIPAAHRARQAEIVAAVGSSLGVPLAASDVVLLAHHSWTAGLPPAVAPLRRAGAVRYCLTPALDRLFAGAAGPGRPNPPR